MTTEKSLKGKSAYTISSTSETAANPNERVVRLMRDGEPVKNVLIVSTSSASAYFRESALQAAKPRG